MRPVRRAALALAAAVPLALSTARAGDPAPARAKEAPPASAGAGATSGGSAGAELAPPAKDAAKDFFAPKASKAKAWSSPARGDDDEDSVEVVRGAGRCGG